MTGVLDESPVDKAIRLQNGLIVQATGGGVDGGDDAYKDLRRYFLVRADTKQRLPEIVQRCRDLGQFWGVIKQQFAGYAERRAFLWDTFHPLVDYLEAHDQSPGTAAISSALERFDPAHIAQAWQKALDRRLNDPEGAITAARALLESVCKHVLDDAGAMYPDDADLPKLWGLTAEQLNLLPSQHEETVFKAILGNVQAVVGNLAAIRNRVGDAHGQGRKAVKPKPRHAELAVNLAGSIASFIVSTWQERQSAQQALTASSQAP
ncbi:MAG: abortive infection family protein [Reyranellaceae bacterium]